MKQMMTRFFAILRDALLPRPISGKLGVPNSQLPEEEFV